jgi:hypothetical protein
MKLADAKAFHAAIGAAIAQAETSGADEVSLLAAAADFDAAARAELQAAIDAANAGQ